MTKKSIPWYELHKIADQLKGKLHQITGADSHDREYKKIVIEYEEEKTND